MNPTLQLEQSVVCPKECPTKRKLLRNIFIGVGVLFALARVMFAGTGETGLVTSRRILRTTPVNGHK